ncbi:MAG: hypothetical protein QF898_11750 [SAR202 cluster bacterium]|jgi:uncharacterized membrane protein|nr:hypothetical protein [SAR202 cluster bacterium]
MSISDLFLLVVLWVHLVSATAWVGGSIFYLFVLRPALRKSSEGGREVNIATADEFRALVDTTIFVLLATGIILTFNRVTPGVIGVQYVAVLGLKIALSIWMFILARDRRRRTAMLEMYRERPEPPSGFLRKALRAVSGYNTIVILGLVVLLLADALGVLFEIAVEAQ